MPTSRRALLRTAAALPLLGTARARAAGRAPGHLAFDRFYLPGLPKLKTVRMVAYADENARVGVLHAGDVDLIE